MSFEDYLGDPQFALPQARKEARLLDDLNALTCHHRDRCAPYARILDRMGWEPAACRLDEVPFIPVSLFKSHSLTSVPASDRDLILTSSGTSGQAVSRLTVDGVTADRQTRALNAAMRQALGPHRLPMIIVDTRTLLRDRQMMNARGAGVIGMMRFGRDHFFALDDEMRLDRTGLAAFLEKWRGRDIAIFGFTYMMWKYLFQELVGGDFDLSRATLVHSGGWKRLADAAVDPATVRRRWHEETGLERIYNFYGMAEQIGSVFLEGADGLLYPPDSGDVIIRDPATWQPAPIGAVGVIQVLSLLPLSYPGHSILTEDLGILHHVDRPESAGRWGKAISVVGRVPAAQLRGCSDVHAFSRSQAAA